MAHRIKFIVEYCELKSSLKMVRYCKEEYYKSTTFNKAKRELINFYKGRISEWKTALVKARKLKRKNVDWSKHVQKRRKRKDAGENCIPL